MTHLCLFLSPSANFQGSNKSQTTLNICINANVLKSNTCNHVKGGNYF